MAQKEFLADRRRSQEEEYIHRQEQQLIAKLRQRRQAEATRRRMAERTGIVDQETLGDLQALGYTLETVMLLNLVPLLEVAWAEGGISEHERALIVEAARAHGANEGSAADRQLATWLATQPAADLFEHTRRAIGVMLEAAPPEEREARGRDLLAYCVRIASASGGILGFGKISPQEQEVIARISKQLRHAPHPDVRAAASDAQCAAHCP
jgi:hypothetical protein